MSLLTTVDVIDYTLISIEFEKYKISTKEVWDISVDRSSSSCTDTNKRQESNVIP